MLIGTVYPPKPPTESSVIEIDFGPDLVAGETIASSATTAKKLSDGSDAASILSGGDVIAGTWVKKRVVGGVAGETYRIQITITTNGNNSYQHEVDVPVSAT